MCSLMTLEIAGTSGQNSFNGNRRPWPNPAVSHRGIRSFRQVKDREHREKNGWGEPLLETSLVRLQVAGKKRPSGQGRAPSVGAGSEIIAKGRPGEDPERNLLDFTLQQSVTIPKHTQQMTRSNQSA